MRFGIRELVLVATLLGILIASFTLVFLPQNAAIDRAKREIDHKMDLLEKLAAETDRNEALRERNEEIARRIGEIEDRLPSDKQVDSVIRQVSELAVRSGLNPPAMQNAKPVPAAQYWEQPLELKTGGTFRGFYDFLIELERMPRITRINSMKLDRARNEEGRMDVEFTLSIYFQNAGGPTP